MTLKDMKIKRVPKTDARYPNWWWVYLPWKNFYKDGKVTFYIVGQGRTRKAAVGEAKGWMMTRHFHKHMVAYEHGAPFPGIDL